MSTYEVVSHCSEVSFYTYEVVSHCSEVNLHTYQVVDEGLFNELCQP